MVEVEITTEAAMVVTTKLMVTILAMTNIRTLPVTAQIS